MLALTIRQPWAHAILHLGKDIENRNWKTKYRGPFLIHAGKMLDTSYYYHIGGLFPRDMDVENMEFGALLGVAHITDVVTDPYTDPNLPVHRPPMHLGQELTGESGKVYPRSKWFEGKYGFMLSHVEKFDRPIRCKGKQGFFKVGEEIYNSAMEQVLVNIDRAFG